MNGPGLNLDQYMYGYARIIKYTKGSAESIYEGQIGGKWNKWSGFGRYIKTRLAVGWFDDFKSFNG